MKKEQLKKSLKPLIKECIKEVIFEEGILSGIISEVLKGTSGASLLENQTRQHSIVSDVDRAERQEKIRQESLKKKRKLLDSIGKSYNGVNLFEGTEPLPNSGGGSSQGEGYALRDVDPNDPGVDLSAFGLSTKKFKI